MLKFLDLLSGKRNKMIAGDFFQIIVEVREKGTREWKQYAKLWPIWQTPLVKKKFLFWTYTTKGKDFMVDNYKMRMSLAEAYAISYLKHLYPVRRDPGEVRIREYDLMQTICGDSEHNKVVWLNGEWVD